MTTEATSYESWIGSSSWDVVGLGSITLPGVCSIKEFKVGQDIDVQKKRKKEKARIRDNGAAPCSFKIIVELTAKLWADWQTVLPSIQPQRAGAVRTPLAITHPLPNSNGIVNVYVREIAYDEPTARGGMKITIDVHEWFEEVVDTKTEPNVDPPRYTKRDAQYVDYAEKLVDPRNEANMRSISFGDEHAFDPIPVPNSVQHNGHGS